MSKVKFSDVVNNIKVNIDREHNPYNHYIAGDHMDTEDIHLRRKGSFETDDVGPAFTRLFKIGQILYGSRRTYLKKAAIADFEGITANTTFVFESRDESIFLTKLLPFLIQSNSFTEWSVKKSKGSTNPYVVFSDLANFEFELPELKIQKEYEDILWKIDNTREAYRNLISSLDKLNKSRFIELFGDIKEKNKWPREKWSDVCEIINGKDFKSVEDPNGQYAVYGTGGFMAKANQYTCPENSIIIGRKGTINKPLLVKEKFWNIDTAFGVVPNITKVHYQYFYWFCKQFNFMSINKGTTLPSTTKTDLQKIEINVPPLELQLHFSHLVDQIDKSKFNLKRAIHELDLLTEKITSRLFCLNDKHK